ncbi:MAG: OmpA family protein [Gemmatimonadetes bacterium]|nr:OmpA family protein [Gemmatimonadota bacterium]
MNSRRSMTVPAGLVFLCLAHSLAGQEAQTKAADVWVNYDFVPGERVLFFEDFARDPVGDFPARLQLVNGNMEVAEWKGTRVLRATSTASFDIPFAQPLPDRFTLEAELYITTSGIAEITAAPEGKRAQTTRVFCGPTKAGAEGAGVNAQASLWSKNLRGTVVTCRFMAAGNTVKVYLNEERVANVPNASLGRSNKLRFTVDGTEKYPVFISSLRVAAGGRPMLYDELASRGRVAARGILFDTGSDRLRPESLATLRDIAAMLAQHPELRLLIEGHTDNVGQASANQKLSETRAAAVRGHLIGELGVTPERLESKGFGAAKPVDTNNTPEGRQNNRRVELVKL